MQRIHLRQNMNVSKVFIVVIIFFGMMSLIGWQFVTTIQEIDRETRAVFEAHAEIARVRG